MLKKQKKEKMYLLKMTKTEENGNYNGMYLEQKSLLQAEKVRAEEVKTNSKKLTKRPIDSKAIPIRDCEQ